MFQKEKTSADWDNLPTLVSAYISVKHRQINIISGRRKQVVA